MVDDLRHSRAACPRCGYDLRGAIATWQEACPIDGICTECGLRFAWREILSTRFTMPKWCIEAKRGAMAVPRQVAGTAARTWWPWAFWSGLHMTHLTRWRRLALYHGLLLVILYLMFAGSHAFLAWSFWHRVASDPRSTVTTSGWPVVMQAGLTPFSNRSVGFFKWRNQGRWPYETPLTLVKDYWLDLPPSLLLALAMHSCCGLAFAALPVTRRRCKVRWSHIVRVTLHGYALFFGPFAMAIMAVGAEEAPLPSGIPMTLAIGTWILLVPSEICWWSVATSTYLRMPHAWGVGIAVVMIGSLVPLTVVGRIWVAL